MSCCVIFFNNLKKKLDILGIQFDIFFNNIFEVNNNSDNDYDLIDLDETKKNDHVVIDIPIKNDYNII